jgi:hypothetical protein
MLLEFFKFTQDFCEKIGKISCKNVKNFIKSVWLQARELKFCKNAFAMKVLKLKFQILKFRRFALDFFGKENGLHTSSQYVETRLLAHQKDQNFLGFCVSLK